MITSKTGTVYFDPQDKIYREHFPGFAVVPGSVIIQAFLDAHSRLAATRVNDGDGKNTRCSIPPRISHFRFKRFVTPGTYQYQLEIYNEKSDCIVIRCRLMRDNQTFVTGRLTPCS